MAAIALALASALLYAACFPPFEWPLTWLALVPLLAALDRPGAGRAALAGAVWGAATTAAVVAWLLPTLTGYYERSLPAALGVFAVVAATALAPWFALAFAALGAARDRLPRTAWLALVPVAWVAAELLRTRFGLQSSWALLGDAHYESARLRQVAALFGVYGVSALVALGNAVAYELLRLAVNARTVKQGAGPWMQLREPIVHVGAAFVLLLGAALGYGAQRRIDPAADAARPAIVLVQAALEPSLRWQRSGALRTLRRHADLTERALAESATPPVLVVWPENAIQTEPSDAVYGPPLARFAASLPAPLLVGAPRSDDAGGRFNAAHRSCPAAREATTTRCGCCRSARRRRRSAPVRAASST
jgi:apolipoprotein N-acyltransferase